MRTYYDPARTTCVPCGPSCHHCESADSCCLCEFGFNLVGTNDCFIECPPGYFNTGDHQDYNDTPFCDTCHESCALGCLGDSDEDCTVCPINQVIWSDLLDRTTVVEAREHDITVKGKCIDSTDCDGGFGPMLGVCVECMDNCQECSEERCLLCEPGMVELPDGSCGEVLWDLEPGCDIGREDRCEQCVGGFDLVDGHCIPVCGPRQWFDSSADEY